MGDTTPTFLTSNCIILTQDEQTPGYIMSTRRWAVNYDHQGSALIQFWGYTNYLYKGPGNEQYEVNTIAVKFRELELLNIFLQLLNSKPEKQIYFAGGVSKYGGDSVTITLEKFWTPDA